MYSESTKVIGDIKTKKFDEVILKKINELQKKPEKGKKEKQLDKIREDKKRDIVNINDSIDDFNKALDSIQLIPLDLTKKKIS